jgi:uncharacterized membrane protein
MNRNLALLTRRVERLEREVAALKKRRADSSSEREASPEQPRPHVRPRVPEIHSGSDRARRRGRRNFEQDLLGNWFPRLGALALLVGAGFAFKYAVDRGLIGPGVRIASGLVLSAVLLWMGETTRTRGWLGFSQAVTGGGVAVLYLTIWAAHSLFAMLPGSVAFALLVMTTSMGAGLALRHDSQPLAALSVLGGFLNPMIAGSDAAGSGSLFAYTVALDLGVLGLAYLRRWSVIDRMAFMGSWLLFAASGVQGGGAIAFATTLFAIFGTVPFLHSVARRQRADYFDLLTLGSNAVVYYFVVAEELTTFASDWIGPFTLLLAAAFFLQGIVIKKVATDGLLELGTFAIAGTLFTVWFPLEFELKWLPALWAIEGCVLMAAGHALRSDKTIAAAGAVLGLALLALLLWITLEDFRPSRPLLSRDGLVVAIVIGALYVACRLERRLDSTNSAGIVAGVLANVLTLGWLSLEAKALILRDAPADGFRTIAFTYSAIWAVYAGILLGVGIAIRTRWLRLLSVCIFAVTLWKLVVHDLWLVSPLHRIVSFAGLGVLLLLSSLAYHRFARFIWEPGGSRKTLADT